MATHEVRVLHVIEDLGYGGAERLLGTLLPLLPARGFRADVAALGRREALAEPLRHSGILVHQLRLGSLGDVRAALWGLHRVIQRHHYDLLHTHLTHANLYGRIVARLAGIPVTSTYHDSDYEPAVLIANPKLPPWKRQAYLLADRFTARVCRRVIAVSQFVARSIQRHVGFSPEAVEVIYNGVARDTLARPASGTRLHRRRELGLREGGKIVVQLGRLTPQKGPLQTVRAAAQLRDLREVYWVLVGGGPLMDELRHEIEVAGLRERVQLVGERADPRAFLEAADLLVLPSLHEGLGIAALEAMAAGLPVVAHDTGPIPEVIIDGETGVLVPVGDAAALAQAIRSLLEDQERARAMGEKGRARVQERFLIDGTADRHAAFYERLLALG